MNATKEKLLMGKNNNNSSTGVNLWDILLNNHDILKSIIKFLSFPDISINRSILTIISANRETRDYMFKYMISKITITNENNVNFLINIIEKDIEVLKYLRVCYLNNKYNYKYNCSNCEKCLG